MRGWLQSRKGDAFVTLPAAIGTHVRSGYVGKTTDYDHRSLLSLTMKALGVPNIPNGADAAPLMTEFFH